MTETRPPTVEYTRQRITQGLGPSLRFDGRLLCTTSYESGARDRFYFTLEIWETRGGALIGSIRKAPLSWDGDEDCDAVVVEPGGDVQAGHFAIMDLFRWDDRARTMARRKLKWNLTRVVA